MAVGGAGAYGGRMELRHLRYFVAVAEEGNIGRAAERLHMSQPPLTRQIALLERELGAQLFTRSNRGVVLTNAGRVLLDDARRMLHQAEQAADRATRAGEGAAGRLDIALFGTGIFGAIPQLLRAFRAEAPDAIVSDIGMPEQDGYDLIRQVRAMPAALGGAVPAVALSALSRAADRDRSVRAGFQLHVAKPISVDDVVAAVRSLVGPA